MPKHILFVGDLRPCYNYGAIATTESLLQMLRAQNPDADIRIIDARSFGGTTPVGGWDTPQQSATPAPSLLQRLRSRLWPISYYGRLLVKSLMPYGLVYGLRKPQKPVSYVPNMNYGFPYLYRDYESWGRQVLSGEKLPYEKRLLEWADEVIVNGEGNVVHGTDENGVYRRNTLYNFFITWCAKVVFHKPTYLVNHTVDPDNSDAIEIIQHLYPLLDKVIVREPLSIDKLRSYGITNAEYYPDALFSYRPAADWQLSEVLRTQIDFSRPYILVGDSSGFHNNYSRCKWNVAYHMSALVRKLQHVCPQVIFVDGFTGWDEGITQVIRDCGIGHVNLRNCSYEDLYHVMQRAQIFVSGRWHASILSVLAGTPILLWGSDSHKTRALYTMMDYPYRFFDVATLPLHLDEVVDECKLILSHKDEIRQQFSDKVAEYSKATYGNVSFIK